MKRIRAYLLPAILLFSCTEKSKMNFTISGKAGDEQCMLYLFGTDSRYLNAFAEDYNRAYMYFTAMSYYIEPTQEELDAYGDIKYYGFTAKLYYKGEPLDCLSSPSALVLQEQRLKSRNREQHHTPTNSLLPDDGLVPTYEEALPASDFLPELPLPQ